MDQTVVSQATHPSIPQMIATEVGTTGANLITLARMEIGGIRFVLPLSDIAAVIEPTTMEKHSDDPHGIWIGHVRSSRGAIAIASGSALLRTEIKTISPGRIAILRGEYPVGLAVDRMLAAQAVNRESLIPLPSFVPAIQSSPVVAAVWGEDDELELLLERGMLIDELDSDFLSPKPVSMSSRYAQQKLIDRYGDVDYGRGLEVHFDASMERWILPMSTVRLVTDSRTPHPLPRTPQKISGLVSWQRNPIPVIDPSYDLDLPRPISLPAKFAVVGEPVGSGQTSIQADAAILVDKVVGILDNIRIEHGYAWDAAGDALNILKVSDILS